MRQLSSAAKMAMIKSGKIPNKFHDLTIGYVERKSTMIRAIWFKIGIALLVVNCVAVVIIVVCIAAGGAYVIWHDNFAGMSKAVPASAFQRQSQPDAHTIAWYVAHPDILKQYERRCADDAATMSPAPCQDVYSAEAQLSAGRMQKAVSSK